MDNITELESLDEALAYLNESKYVEVIEVLTDKNINDGLRIVRYEASKSKLNINILSKSDFSYPKGDKSEIIIAEVLNSNNPSIKDLKAEVTKFVLDCRKNKFYDSKSFTINAKQCGSKDRYGIEIYK